MMDGICQSPKAINGAHEPYVEGNPHSYMTRYVCSLCGKQESRGTGVFFKEEKMSEWTELKTLQEVAAAQARGDEIEVSTPNRPWREWSNNAWVRDYKYRSRPRKQKKTVVLREALFCHSGVEYSTNWCSEEFADHIAFVRWLDTPPREVEVAMSALQDVAFAAKDALDKLGAKR